MKTTLDIDDDVLQAAERMARQANRSTGEVISDLVRRALPQKVTRTPEEFARAVDELPCLPRRPGPPVTTELVMRLLDQDD